MKILTVRMPNNDVYGVPVDVIARNRAAFYAYEFDGDVERSLREDTVPLFESDAYEVTDWAKNNMNWSDVKHAAFKIESWHIDFQRGWTHGDVAVRDATVSEESIVNCANKLAAVIDAEREAETT